MVDGIHETSRLQLIQSPGVRGKPILRKLLRESLDLLVTACNGITACKVSLAANRSTKTGANNISFLSSAFETHKKFGTLTVDDSCVLVYWLSIGTFTVCQKRLISCVLVVPIRCSSRSNGTIDDDCVQDAGQTNLSIVFPVEIMFFSLYTINNFHKNP